MSDRLAALHSGLERRVFSVERRFREFSALILDHLHQMRDVRIRFTGPDMLADGDVLTWDDDIERWVNLPPGGGDGGALPCASIRGATGGSSDWVETEWTFPAGGIELDLYDEGGTIGIVPTHPGLYAAHCQILTGTGRARIFALTSGGGWQHADETDECRPFPFSIDSGSVVGASASVLMPCVWTSSEEESVTGVRVLVDDDDGEVLWRLQVHLVRAVDLLLGECPG